MQQAKCPWQWITAPLLRQMNQSHWMPNCSTWSTTRRHPPPPSFLGFCYYPVLAVWQNHFNVCYVMTFLSLYNSLLWVATGCALMICLLLLLQLFQFYPAVVVLVFGCYCCVLPDFATYVCSDFCSNNCDLFDILFHLHVVSWIRQWKYIEQISTKHQSSSNFKHRSGRCHMTFTFCYECQLICDCCSFFMHDLIALPCTWQKQRPHSKLFKQL